jgi:hypothetical protein
MFCINSWDKSCKFDSQPFKCQFMKANDVWLKGYKIMYKDMFNLLNLQTYILPKLRDKKIVPNLGKFQLKVLKI